MNLIEAIKRVDTFKREKCKRNLSITTNNEIIEPDASIEGIYNHIYNILSYNIIYYIYISHYITHVQSFCANAKICQVAPALKLLWSLPKSQGSPSSDRVCPVASWPGKLRHAALGAGCHLRQLSLFRQRHSLHPPPIFGDLWRGFCTTQCKPEQVDRSCFIFPSQVR